MFLVTVKSGEEVIETIARTLAERGVRSGAIVSLFGAVDFCAISNIPADDPDGDLIAEYKQPLEISGTGEVADGEPHVHCVVSGEGHPAIAGHLLRAVVGPWFVNAYIIPMSDTAS
jgi:predicted DNA-binding protein with PD1-like motif